MKRPTAVPTPPNGFNVPAPSSVLRLSNLIIITNVTDHQLDAVLSLFLNDKENLKQ